MGVELDEDDEDDMGRRLSQLAGLLVLAMILSRAGRLVQFGDGETLWHLVLIAAALLGGVLWWLMLQFSIKPTWAFTVFVVGAAIVFLRVAVPETLTFGVVPTSATLPALAESMQETFRIIRSGVAPVIPSPGLIAILAVMMWVLGGLYAQGATTGNVAVMMIPAGTAYLQFAVFDRRSAGLPWMLISAFVIGLALAGLALDRRESVGRARDSSGLPIAHNAPRAALLMATVVGLVSVMATTNAVGVVSEYGNLPWQSGGPGFGSGPGGNVLFDRFVDLRQRLISRENALLFRATLGPGAPPANEIYWRMETLDEFDGVAWRRGNGQTRVAAPSTPVGDPQHSYRGNSTSILQRVFIARLGGTLMPTAGDPRTIHEISGANTIRPGEVRFGRDGALFRPVGVTADDNYQLESVYPLTDADLGPLATDTDGELSPLFASAAEDGLFSGIAGPPPGSVDRPDNIEEFLDLPQNFPGQLTATALRMTRGAATDFEKAWMLQHWFRDSGDFTYSQEVSTGHGALVLEEWLNSPSSENYRTGYCEQFAAAMGVLGRVLDIPTRVVWGFTPGASVTIDGLEVIEVRDTNAHAWVEMWMDGFGWVRFDPTPRGEGLPPSMTAGWQPADHVAEPGTGGVVVGPEPQDPTIDDTPSPLDPGTASPFDRNGGPRWWLIGIPGIALLFGIVPLVKRFRRNRRLARARDGDITALWDEIVDRLADLGDPVTETMTPLEWAGSKGSALLPLARGYASAVYGDKHATLTDDQLMELEWWMQSRYDGRQRLVASMNPRSLFRD